LCPHRSQFGIRMSEEEMATRAKPTLQEGLRLRRRIERVRRIGRWLARVASIATLGLTGRHSLICISPNPLCSWPKPNWHGPPLKRFFCPQAATRLLTCIRPFWGTGITVGSLAPFCRLARRSFNSRGTCVQPAWTLGGFHRRVHARSGSGRLGPRRRSGPPEGICRFCKSGSYPHMSIP